MLIWRAWEGDSLNGTQGQETVAAVAKKEEPKTPAEVDDEETRKGLCGLPSKCVIL